MTRTFWKGRKVFLTGHTGFKGGWMALWLSDMGADVTGYALKPVSDRGIYQATGAESLVKSIIGDVRDAELLKKTVKKTAPEIVFHFAAQPIVLESYNDPVGTFATNVMGTVNVLEAVRHCPDVKAVVNVTTDKCYENKEWIWGYREHEALGGYDPYSSSKACSELVTAAYRNSFFNSGDCTNRGAAIATARAGNVIGGGDWAENRIVPDSMLALLTGQPIMVRNPHSIRPWQHVLEPLRAYLFLAEKLYNSGREYAESWNFGPLDGEVESVETIVKTLCEYWGAEATYQIHTVEQKHEAGYLKIDSSKAWIRLGWRPYWTLRQALKNVVDWTREFQKGNDLLAVSLQQIHAYEKMMIEKPC